MHCTTNSLVILISFKGCSNVRFLLFLGLFLCNDFIFTAHLYILGSIIGWYFFFLVNGLGLKSIVGIRALFIISEYHT